MNNCEICQKDTEELARDPNEGLLWVCRSCAEGMYDNSPPLNVVLDAAFASEIFRDELSG